MKKKLDEKDDEINNLKLELEKEKQGKNHYMKVCITKVKIAILMKLNN